MPKREATAAAAIDLAGVGAEVEVACERERRPERAQERQRAEVEVASGLEVRSDARVPSSPVDQSSCITSMEPCRQEPGVAAPKYD